MNAQSLLRDERGSAAIEAVTAVPAFGLLVGLLIFGARTAITHDALQSAATDAARIASLSRNPTTASLQAQQAAATSVANQHLHCTNLTVQVNTAALTKAAGQPGTITVTVSCRLNLSDLVLPGVPGSKVLTATMTSPVDTWRQAP